MALKFKTTKKAVMTRYSKVICVGYCSLPYLLSRADAVAYTCGVYGWNADVYDFGNVAIVTGYRPFGNVHVDYDLIREYEEMAEKARYSMNYEDGKKYINELLAEFIKIVTE